MGPVPKCTREGVLPEGGGRLLDPSPERESEERVGGLDDGPTRQHAVCRCAGLCRRARMAPRGLQWPTLRSRACHCVHPLPSAFHTQAPSFDSQSPKQPSATSVHDATHPSLSAQACSAHHRSRRGEGRMTRSFERLPSGISVPHATAPARSDWAVRGFVFVMDDDLSAIRAIDLVLGSETDADELGGAQQECVSGLSTVATLTPCTGLSAGIGAFYATYSCS